MDLKSISEVSFKIKPLKWKVCKTDFCQTYAADVANKGYYIIERCRDDKSLPWGDWKVKYNFQNWIDEGTIQCESLEDGKEKALEDWLKRLLPALEINIEN